MTTSTALTSRGHLDATGRAWLVVVVVAVTWLSLMALFPGLPGPSCLFHAITGFDCLGCGMTRACRALLHGDIRGALALHPLVFFVTGFIAVHTARIITDWWYGRAWPGPLPRPLAAVVTAVSVLGFVVVAVDRARPIVAAVVAAIDGRSP
jgi:hypothetical protein